MRRFIYNIVIIGMVIFLIVTGVRSCAKMKKKEIKGIPVAAVKAEVGTIVKTLFYVGDIKAQDEVEVYPRVTGKVLENTVREGDHVKKGDIIAFVDRDEIGFEFEKAPVSSPIDGIVGKVYLDRGVSVSVGTPIAKVVDMDMMKVRIDVIERELPKLKVGQQAQISVDAYPQEIFAGGVDRVSPIVDLASRTALVEIKIPNPDHRLKPGMFTRVEIVVDERKDVLVIPKDAIIREDSSDYVFAVRDNNKVYRQKIETGLYEDNKFEVINGLGEGEVVVTMGNTRLKEGDMVEVLNNLGAEQSGEQKE